MTKHLIQVSPEEDVKELRELVKHLTKRAEYFEQCREMRMQKVLENPTDKVIEKEMCFIHEYQKQIDCIWNIIREANFDIEDITGEPEA